MAEVINMPRLSDTMEEGNIVGWLKKVGDQVKPGEVLAEVETDKATMELESFHSGTLLHIGVPEGPVKVGALLAIIGKEGEDISALLNGGGDQQSETEQPDDKGQTTDSNKEIQKDDKSTGQPADAVAEQPAAQSVTAQKQAKSAPVEAATSNEGRIKASPLAKSLARESGVDLQNLEGSGDGGRIVKSDVQKAMQQPKAEPTVAQPSISPGEDKTIALTQIRKTIARRLGESKNSAPHFYVTVEVDMEKTIAAREALNASGDYKISYNDLIVKASAAALRKHPGINASWTGDSIVQHGNIHIGVAVAAPDGLMVPVIKNADQKSLAQLNTEIRELASRAKDKKLNLNEMQGNTFTISNLGMFDVESFTAIINPPDACILAVGSIVAKPVVKDNQVVPGNTLKLTLSSDHRLVDGVVAAQFLGTLKQMLENPVFILL